MSVVRTYEEVDKALVGLKRKGSVSIEFEGVLNNEKNQYTINPYYDVDTGYGIGGTGMMGGGGSQTKKELVEEVKDFMDQKGFKVNEIQNIILDPTKNILDLEDSISIPKEKTVIEEINKGQELRDLELKEHDEFGIGKTLLNKLTDPTHLAIIGAIVFGGPVAFPLGITFGFIKGVGIAATLAVYYNGEGDSPDTALFRAYSSWKLEMLDIVSSTTSNEQFEKAKKISRRLQLIEYKKASIIRSLSFGAVGADVENKNKNTYLISRKNAFQEKLNKAFVKAGIPSDF